MLLGSCRHLFVDDDDGLQAMRQAKFLRGLLATKLGSPTITGLALGNSLGEHPTLHLP